jgi:hypothetical protein
VRPTPCRPRLLTAALLPLLGGCSVWFFSGETSYEWSHPVALVETTGGVELGATTEFGILTLGRTATDGPCRVRYFLGPTPLVESGTLGTTGSLFTRAEIDLKTMAVRGLDRPPLASDELLVMWTPDGTTTESVPVRLARSPDVEGDVLQHPGRDLPPGATVLAQTRDDGLLFVGLIAGKATVEGGDGAGEYYVFAGVDRIREMLAVPQVYPTDMVPKYRTDGISVMKPREEEPPPPEPQGNPLLPK